MKLPCPAVVLGVTMAVASGWAEVCNGADVVNNLNRTVTLYFLGGPNSANVIQSTARLTLTAWQNVSTKFAGPNGAWQLTDGNNTATWLYRSYAP